MRTAGADNILISLISQTTRDIAKDCSISMMMANRATRRTALFDSSCFPRNSTNKELNKQKKKNKKAYEYKEREKRWRAGDRTHAMHKFTHYARLFPANCHHIYLFIVSNRFLLLILNKFRAPVIFGKRIIYSAKKYIYK